MERLKKTIQILLFSILIFLQFITHPLTAQSSQKSDRFNLLLIKGSYKELIKELNKSLNANSTDFNQFYYLGLAYQGLYKHTDAIEAFIKANNLNPNNMEILLGLGKSYSLTGNDKDAEKTYKKVLSLNSHNIPAAISLGKLYINNKRYGPAKTIYASLIAQDSLNSIFLKNLGLCELKTDYFEKAVSFLKRAKNINKNDVSVFIYLSNIYSKTGDIDSALQALDEGLYSNPDNYLLLKAKAERLFQKELFKEAIDYYKKVYSCGDTSASVYKKLGMCHYHCGNISPSLFALSRAIEKDTTDALIYYYLGLTYKKLKNYKKSIKFINKSLDKLLPTYLPDIYFQLADCYDRNKNYQESIQTYKKVLDLDSKRTITLFYLASLYEKYYADPKVALEYYKRFLDENKDDNSSLIEYSKERIDKLVEEIHFQK